MPSTDEVRALIEEKLKPSKLEVVETSDGCGSKFECVIVSDAFEGLGRLERHTLVNDAIASVMPDIHAFSMKTWTPAQAEAKMQK